MSGRTSTVVEYALRGLVLAALMVGAFWSTWGRLVAESSVGGRSMMVLAAPLGAALTVVALGWRRRPELPIVDRQSDVIVGGVMIVVAVLNQWLLLPRFAGVYDLLHIDVLAAWAYLCAGSVFLFGVRRTGRVWAAWLILALASLGAMRLVVFLLGGGPRAEALVVGAVVVVGPVAVLVGSARRGQPRTRSTWNGPAVPARAAWRSVPLLVVVGLVLWLAPLPDGRQAAIDPGPPGGRVAGQLVPDGWTERSVEEIPWAPRMFGPSSSLYRQLLRADAPRADWDVQLRPRQVVVETLTVTEPGILDVYPIEMTYDLSNARISASEQVDLGHGVRARYRTVVDDERLLTWSLLTFIWTRAADEVQRVTMLTVDNHEHDAWFPEPVHVTGATAGRLLSLLLRGSASISAHDPQPKDLAMLTEFGTALVETQWLTH